MDWRPAALSRGKRFLRLNLPATPEVVDFRGGESLHLAVGELLVHGLDDVLVVLEGPFGMVTAHHVGLADFVVQQAENLVHRHLVGAFIALLLGEVAEAA